MEVKATGMGRRRAESGKKELDGIRIGFGQNGGHEVVHEFKRPPQRGDRYMPAPDPEKFLFGASEGKKAMDHIAEHMKISMAEPNEEMEAKGSSMHEPEEEEEEYA